jgi:hypothetical protein
MKNKTIIFKAIIMIEDSCNPQSLLIKLSEKMRAKA